MSQPNERSSNPSRWIARLRTVLAFNIACCLAAPLIMATMLVLELRAHPSEHHGQEYHDFSQFYMGGLIARHGAWDVLYPRPNPTSDLNPGAPSDSEPYPEYAKLANDAGVPPIESRYILPPPFSLALEPIALFPYRHAKKVWYALMILCATGVAALGGRSYELIIGRHSRIAGGIVLLVALSPLMTGALRYMNITPLIGLLMGLAVFGLLHKRSRGAALALVAGAAAKYATAVLLPLYLVMRKWKALAVMCIATAVILALSLAIMKTGPFRVYFHDIVPTLNRANPHPSNSALLAVLMRAKHPELEWPPPISGALLLAVRIIQWTTLAGLLALIFTRQSQRWRDPATVFAAATLLLCWFLIFSPMFWENYVVYLVPFWGWLVWEGRHSPLKAIAVTIAIVYPCLPDFIVSHPLPFLHLHGQALTLAGPYSTTNLLATLLLCVVAVARLMSRDGETPDRDSDAKPKAADAMPPVEGSKNSALDSAVMPPFVSLRPGRMKDSRPL